MKFNKVLLCVFALTGFAFAHAADIAGTWTSEFDSQIGPQKYIYTFKVDDGKTTGKAAYDHQMGKGENDLTDLKIDKDNISFIETVHANDMDLRISYLGIISGDEIKLTRVVGDYGTEQIVAKRLKSSTALPSKASTSK